MNVLLTFTGFKDPFWDDPASGGDVEGPILSLVRAHPVDRVVLFSTPATERHTASTLKAIRDRFPSVDAELVPIDLDDPTSYAEILDGLRAHLPDIRRENDGAVFFIGTASGTPQMHACWLLLVASGELPAHLMHIRPPRFVDEAKVLVSEIEIDPARFPVIRPPSVIRPTLGGDEGRTLSAIVEALGIVGDHPRLQAALEAAALLAQSDVPVLILGESGTGKEKVAEVIHRMSTRARKRFEKVNCAAIPENLAESMLFGHVRGAFTGAERDNPGAFDAADGGTLFLDEFAELPLATQAKLLRAIENGEIQTVGSTSSKQVDVRVIVATNKDLHEAMDARTFRTDLYHRVNVGRVELPLLRERRSDITKLALHFLDRENARHRTARRFDADALLALEAHAWPGNVRELQNTVARAALLARDGVITKDLLGLATSLSGTAPVPELYEGFSFDEWTSTLRDATWEAALAQAGGNQTKAARLLGVSPQAVSKWARDR